MFAGRIFDISFRTLLVLLPFMTVLSIFTREKLGIPGFSFLKEIFLIILWGVIIISHIKGWKLILLSRYDVAIGLYILIMLVISAFTTGISGIIYGGRYDFAFLLAFLALYHGRDFLEKPASFYIRIFLYSAGVMIFVSLLLKWPFSEDLLLYLGYSGNPSNWQFGSSVPIFHGVDGANVRRFQGLLDGPNTMGAFLLLYIGILLHFFRSYKAWHFFLGMIVSILMVAIVYTYSRSAGLGFIGGVGFITLFLLPKIYRNYRKEFLTVFTLGILVIGFIGLQYAGTMQAILQRGGSTSGHAERMKIGITRFLDHPMGQGLGSAGPAYRHVNNLEGKQRKEIEELDRYYIPESWYIQQMIEGGLFGALAFAMIILLIWYELYRRYIFLAGMFYSLLIMNLFLHTFESAVVSLSLFLLLGLVLAPSHGHTKG